jgi:hypothetical protein
MVTRLLDDMEDTVQYIRELARHKARPTLTPHRPAESWICLLHLLEMCDVAPPRAGRTHYGGFCKTAWMRVEFLPILESKRVKLFGVQYLVCVRCPNSPIMACQRPSVASDRRGK